MRTLKTLALAALSLVALGGAAGAADVSITIDAPASYRAVSHWRDAGGFEGGYGRHERFVEERRHHGYDDDGYRSWPERRHWNRVSEGRHGWGHGGWGHGGCRVIVKRRVNPWGDVIVKRIKTCD